MASGGSEYVICDTCYQEVGRRTYFRSHRYGQCARKRKRSGDQEIWNQSNSEKTVTNSIRKGKRLEEKETRADYIEIKPGVPTQNKEGNKDDIRIDSLPGIRQHQAPVVEIDERFQSEEDIQGIFEKTTQDLSIVDFYAEQDFLKEESKLYGLVKWVLFITLWLQVTNNISDGATEQILQLVCQTVILTKVKTLDTAFTWAQHTASSFANFFPSRLNMLYRWLGIDRDNFERFICCPACYKLYNSIDELECKDRNGKVFYRRCTNETLSAGLCNAIVINKIKRGPRNYKYLPKHIYCYKSLISSLESLLQRPGFEDKCEEWRQRNIPDDVYADIYDGTIWKSFVDQGFLAEESHFALQMNVDWYQPFKRRSNVSIGVIYLVVMNLPREVRYKRENLILLSIIPNLKKEPETLETFLNPLVEELKSLWRYGSFLKTYKYPMGKSIKCALLCTASDIPAARKLCGFLSHAAKLGCSKCLHNFQGGKKRNCGRFQKDQWKKRTKEQHQTALNQIKQAATHTKRCELESKYGLRDTPLNKLSYFDPIKFCAIDPMHNLFLGTAKRMWKLWTNQDKVYGQDLLSKDDIKTIDERLKEMKAGMPSKWAPVAIGSNYGAWTAHEWLNWTIYSSGYCLRGLLEGEHRSCWEHFISGCRRIISPCITKTDVKEAENDFLTFCRSVERLYGSKAISPNMHLHNHLDECIDEYGTVFGFWLFSFERYNGVLGDFVTNKRDIEPQLMRRFLTIKEAERIRLDMPPEFADSFVHIISKDDQEEKSAVKYLHMPISSMEHCIDLWKDLSGFEFLDTGSVDALDADEVSLLWKSYKVMYKDVPIFLDQISETYWKHGRLQFGPERFDSKLSHITPKNGWIMAKWSANYAHTEEEFCPAEIKFFMKHDLLMGDKYVPHIFAVVRWFSKASGQCKSFKPWSLWSKNNFENPSFATYLPVQRIYSKFGCVVDGNDLNVIPLQRKIYL